MPSASPISVSVRPPRSMRRCQSALLRARRETSSPSTRPTWASATSAVRRGEAELPQKAGTGEPKILIDDDDAIIGPAKFTGFGGKRILSIGRLAIVLDLGGARLAQVDDGLAGQMAGRDLGAFIHRLPPSSTWPRSCGR